MQQRRRTWIARYHLALLLIFGAVLLSLESASARPILIGAKTSLSAKHSRRKEPATAIFRKQKCAMDTPALLLTEFRGGANFGDDESEGDEYDDEYDEAEDDSDVEKNESLQRKASAEDTSPLYLIVKSVLATTKSVISAVASVFTPADEDDPKRETSLAGQLISAVKNILSAVLNPDGGANSGSVKEPNASSKKANKSTKVKGSGPSDSAPSDFGSYLSQAYGVTDGRKVDERDSHFPVLGGTLNDALKIARSNARLLVILIPSSPPNKKGKEQDNNRKAIESFLSAEASKVAKKKARKTSDTASFILWAAKAGSSEATMAMKRLKVKARSAKGDRRPVLLVAYPAQAIGPKGIPKSTPKVLAQHHCSPPPSTEAMAKWMNELRKRFSKQYAAMQLEMRETQLLQERKEGYKSSVQSDTERKIREKKEEAERLAKEKAEKERLEILEKRREEILESLPEPPGPKVKDAITISIRFSDGRSEKRRFDSDAQLSMVFNWVDATFKVERELTILTTMNGKQTFSWEDASEEKSLQEAGLGRMVGFRVTEKKKDEKEDGNSDEKSDEAQENG